MIYYPIQQMLYYLLFACVWLCLVNSKWCGEVIYTAQKASLCRCCCFDVDSVLRLMCFYIWIFYILTRECVFPIWCISLKRHMHKNLLSSNLWWIWMHFLFFVFKIINISSKVKISFRKNTNLPNIYNNYFLKKLNLNFF